MQTFDNYEIIIVDDASMLDVSNGVKDNFSFCQLKVIRHIENLGASRARNTGLKFAKGKYVAFLDDDDRWLPEKLMQQVQCFQSLNDSLAFVGCGHAVEIDGKVIKRRIPVCPDDPFETFLLGNWLGSTSMPLIRKDRLDEMGGFDTSLPSCQDWDTWLQLCRGGQVAIIPEVLVVRSIHGGQMTADINRKIEGRKRLLEKYYTDLEMRPRHLSKQRQRLGTLSLLAGDCVAARGYYDSAVKVWPLDFVSRLGVVLSMFPGSFPASFLQKVAVEKIGNYYLYH